MPVFLTLTYLTRALLGLVRTLPLAGGGGVSAPPSISETNRRGGKIQTAMERPGRDLSDKVQKFDLDVTCDVTGQVKHKMFDICMGGQYAPSNSKTKRLGRVTPCHVSRPRRPRDTLMEISQWARMKLLWSFLPQVNNERLKLPQKAVKLEKVDKGHWPHLTSVDLGWPT